MPRRPHSQPVATSRTPAVHTPDWTLLAVTGMSPAILTETLWALAHEPEPILPSRLIVVTTSEGRRPLERLFAPVAAWNGLSPWMALRNTLEGAGHDLTGRLRFGLTGDDVRVITAADPATGATRELADIRTPSDNEAAATFLLEQIRGLAANPDLRLLGSLAGGRKTMGALLYACFTLSARESDRLTHVLVNEPFDLVPGFWFPGQCGGPLPGRDGSVHDPRAARIELADVPFVPLGNLFRRELGRAPGSFLNLVNSCRDEIRQRVSEHLRLVVEQKRAAIELNTRRLDLAPREHVVLLFLVTRAKQGGDPILSYRDALDPLNAFRVQFREQADPRDLADFRHGDAWARRFDEDQEIRRALSSLKRKLAGMGPDGADLAGLLPERGRFHLALPGAQIHLR